jgi:glucosamine-6-phosphate deaminase
MSEIPGKTARTQELVGQLRVFVYQNRVELGRVAGSAVAARLRQLLEEQATVHAVFASAPSQNEFFAALSTEPEIEWSRITTFQVDEYVGLGREAPASCARYLSERLFDRVSPGRVNVIDGTVDPIAACRRYADLLKAAPLGLACLGIGENGHLAFNEPRMARFDDPAPMRVITIDATSRRQQVNDGRFPRMADVPAQALTLTIPTLMAAGEIHCVVPGSHKRAAITRTLHGSINTDCPASVLRDHARAHLYLDVDSYPAATA